MSESEEMTIAAFEKAMRVSPTRALEAVRSRSLGESLKGERLLEIPIAGYHWNVLESANAKGDAVEYFFVPAHCRSLRSANAWHIADKLRHGSLAPEKGREGFGARARAEVEREF